MSTKMTVRDQKGGPLCMGKWSCTDHIHTKKCPQEKKVGHFTHVQVSTTQMGSESMCRGRAIRLLHAASSEMILKAPNLPYLTDRLSGSGPQTPVPGAITRRWFSPTATASSDPARARRCSRGGRSTGGLAPPALLESVDGWPLVRLLRKIPGGSRPALYTVFASVSAGSGPSTRGPYAATSPRPPGRSGRPCVRTGA
jgi:hypothetical protein